MKYRDCVDEIYFSLVRMLQTVFQHKVQQNKQWSDQKIYEVNSNEIVKLGRQKSRQDYVYRVYFQYFVEHSLPKIIYRVDFLQQYTFIIIIVIHQ